jgi:SAM-dependent methyltransferase
MTENFDKKVIDGFGDEWQRFKQNELPEAELQTIFEGYFKKFPWDKLQKTAEGFDLGCGSGRWAKFVADSVGELHCIDPSDLALEVAKKNLENKDNCQFHCASVDSIPLKDNSMDFGYSLGVLHHVPNTQDAIKSCVAKLKKGAPFLVYLYYAFDNKPWWFKLIWKMSDIVRKVISKMPYFLRYFLSQLIAIFIYYPLVKISKTLSKIGLDVSSIPLSAYKDNSFYTLRTDALDRFGTSLEQRFTKEEIQIMMENAQLDNVEVYKGFHYWNAIGYKK